MKIGIYGGTFNPPHLGHLTAAAAVIATLKLDKLLLIPAKQPPHTWFERDKRGPRMALVIHSLKARPCCQKRLYHLSSHFER